jgi:hypothetical protein
LPPARMLSWQHVPFSVTSNTVELGVMHAQHQNGSAQLKAIDLYKIANITTFSGQEIYKARKSILATNINFEF